MNPKDKIDEKKEFEINFDDLDTAKAKAEAELRGETVEDTPTKKVEKPAPGKVEDESEEEEEETENFEEPKKEDKAPAKEEPKKVSKKETFPKKTEGESDEAYNLRMQLKIAKEGRDTAKTPEEKSVFERKMDDLRQNLSEANKKTPEGKPKEEVVEEPTTEITEDTLKKLGLVKKDDVEKIFSEKLTELRRNEIVDGHQQAIKAFYKERPDIASNREVKDFLEQYVIDLIKPDLNTTPRQLFEAMKLVANANFPKANRSATARAAQEKVDAMNIEGGGAGGQGKKSTVGDKEGDLLRSMGWSDDDIKSFG